MKEKLFMKRNILQMDGRNTQKHYKEEPAVIQLEGLGETEYDGEYV